MADQRRSDEGSGLSIHVPAVALPLVILAVAVAVFWVGSARDRARLMESQLSSLSATLAAASDRERALEETIARQHEQLITAEGDLDAIRQQVEAIELQLDGVGTLSRQLREDLGLPADSGTRASDEGAATPQGGPFDPSTPDSERLAWIQQRLAWQLQAMYALRAEALARRDQEANGVPGALAAAEAVREPANWPARGSVTSDYGWRLFRGRPGFHTGIDLALDPGTAVVATALGTIIGSGWQPGYGWCVLVQHDGGYNTLYAHLSELWVRLGDAVRQGDVIGLSGNSGNSTGPHLHYEIWKDGAPVDPRPSMDVGGIRH